MEKNIETVKDIKGYQQPEAKVNKSATLCIKDYEFYVALWEASGR
jgi:hypothetical protein